MKTETNLLALQQSPGFAESLLVSNEIIQARQQFDQAGKMDPANFAKATIRLHKANNLCAKLVRQQYYPPLKSLVLAYLQDWRLNANPQFTKTSFEPIYQYIRAYIDPYINRCNAFLHVANAIKPMVLKALKELENEGKISVQKPPRKKWNRVSLYEVV